MDAILGLIGMMVLMALGAPIFVALGVAAMIMLALEGRPLMDAAMTSISGINSTTFLAVPFFVMAATFMQRGASRASSSTPPRPGSAIFAAGWGWSACWPPRCLPRFPAVRWSRRWRWAPF